MTGFRNLHGCVVIFSVHALSLQPFFPPLSAVAERECRPRGFGRSAERRTPRAAFPAYAGRQGKLARNSSTLFSLALKAQRKKLCKKETPGEGVSPTAVGDKGRGPLTAPPFEKGGRKLFASVIVSFLQSKGVFRRSRRKRRISFAEPHFNRWCVSTDWLSALADQKAPHILFS